MKSCKINICWLFICSIMSALLAFLFLLFVADSANAQPKQSDTCAAIKDDRARLTCYDLIFQKSVTSKPQTTDSKWDVRTETSKINDNVNSYASLKPLGKQTDKYGRAFSPSLWIACRENKTSLWIHFDNHMSDHAQYGNVTFRIDKNQAFKKSLSASTNNQALFYPSGKTLFEFAKKLIPASTLLVRATPYGENSITLEFPVSGLAEAIKPIRKACNW